MSESKQQTAVECLEEAFYNTEMSFNEIIALAKQMEKEQMKKAFIDGFEFFDFEQYYNETYKNTEI